jgi:hypothetical protein
MKDAIDHEAELLPDIEPESFAAEHPLKDVPAATTAKQTLKILKNCGDCEPGGFGSTYGFGPR